MLQRSGHERSDDPDSSAGRTVPMEGFVRGRLWIAYVIGALATLAGYYA